MGQPAALGLRVSPGGGGTVSPGGGGVGTRLEESGGGAARKVPVSVTPKLASQKSQPGPGQTGTHVNGFQEDKALLPLSDGSRLGRKPAALRELRLLICALPSEML